MNKKIGILVVILLILVIILLFMYSMKDNKKNENIYGTVLDYSENVLTIKTVEGEIVKINTDEELEIGTLVNISYEKKEVSVDVIADKEELGNMINNENSNTTTTTTTTVTTTNTTNVTTTTQNVLENKDDLIINYVNSTYQNVTNGEQKDHVTLKEHAIEIIDFIFYDTPIKGVYFKDLTSEAKAKVIYFALLIDEKVDNLIPNYKDTLADKYKSIKGKLVAKYMELTNNLCEKHDKACSILKSDFDVLKHSLSVSWDFIKDAYSYASDKTVTSITNWYKIWSGKE